MIEISQTLFEIWDTSPFRGRHKRNFHGDDTTLEGALKSATTRDCEESETDKQVPEGSYLTRIEIERQISAMAKFLINLDDSVFSRTSRTSHLPNAVEFIKSKSDRKQEVIVCFGANFLDQLRQRFEDGDFENLRELVNVSLAQAEVHFRSWVQDESEQALITDKVKKSFSYLASDILGLDS